MLLHSIRSRLLGLVLATVIPFTGLIGFGLWNQWRSDQAAALQRAVDDQDGRLRAVLAIGTMLDHFQDALRLQRLPPGSIVKIANENGIGIAHSAGGLDWIGRDLSKVEAIARHIAAKEISEVVRWS